MATSPSGYRYRSAEVYKKIGDDIYQIFLENHTENITLTAEDSTLLSTKLAEMVAAINLREKSTDVDSKIQAAIDALVDGAPATYDTLKEISDYLSTHNDEYTALVQTVANKVDKVSGKALSTNDYTTTEKTKLSGIAAGAQVNVIEQINVNGTKQTPSNKIVNISVPTGALASKSQVSETDLESALKEKVNAASDGNHSHANKTVLDGITASNITAWNDKANIYYLSSKPTSAQLAGYSEGDMIIVFK